MASSKATHVLLWCRSEILITPPHFDAFWFNGRQFGHSVMWKFGSFPSSPSSHSVHCLNNILITSDFLCIFLRYCTIFICIAKIPVLIKQLWSVLPQVAMYFDTIQLLNQLHFLVSGKKFRRQIKKIVLFSFSIVFLYYFMWNCQISAVITKWFL